MRSSRLQRESRTVTVMMRLYCRKHHAPAAELCPACRQLLDYARQRLDRCRFAAGKTVCARCPVHCYSAPMRQRIKAVMRYAGPRLMARHPILVIQHWLDKRRKKPLVGPQIEKQG